MWTNAVSEICNSIRECTFLCMKKDGYKKNINKAYTEGEIGSRVPLLANCKGVRPHAYELPDLEM
jgi:hypothetical protein